MKYKLKSMIQKEFIIYIFREIIFLLLILFFLYTLSQYYFKTEISIYLVFVFMCFSALLIMVDVKNMYNITELSKRVENLEYMVSNIKKR